MTDLREKIAKQLEAEQGYRGDEHYRMADRILALPELREARERYFPTSADCRFAVIDTKNGGELLASFGLEAAGALADGDTITLPPFKLTRA